MPVLGLLAAFFAAIIFVGYAYQQTTGGNSVLNLPKSGGFQDLLSKPLITSTPTLTPTPTTTPTPTPGAYVPPTLPNERAMKVPILLYHYVSVANKDDVQRNGLSTPPGVLDQQLALLSTNGFTTISLDEMAAAFSGQITMPQKPVILSFDDGYADFYTNAVPLLRKYNMKAMAFIPTGLIGGGSYMTWGQIEELSKSANVTFGAHTIHHVFLPKSLPSVSTTEILESKDILEKHVGYRVNWFAYPYGAFNEQVVSEVKSAGFIGSVTTLPGVWQYQSRFFYVPRYRAGTRLGGGLLKLVS